MNVRPCRVVREEPAPGPRQVAADRAALADCASRGVAWMRLHRYLPTASLGRDEAVCHAVREGYCRQAGIPVVRRPAGGGALYLDPGQCCVSLTLPRAWLDGADNLVQVMERGNAAAVRALGWLGIRAEAMMPNDLEVAGRKLGAGFVCIEKHSVLYQSVLLVEPVDTERMLTVLRAPREKLSPRGVQSARERFTTLCDLLPVPAPREPGFCGEEMPPSAPAETRLPWACPGMTALQDALEAALLEEFGLLGLSGGPPPALDGAVPAPVVVPGLEQDWGALRECSWQAFEATPGGVLYLRLDPDASGRQITAATLAGAVHVSPPTLLADLARELTVSSPGAAESRWRRYLDDHDLHLLGFDAQDLIRLLRRALDRGEEQKLGLTGGQANGLMVHPAAGMESAREILTRATVMLVPYCAKPAWCKWRHRDGCPECGKCEVGDAYRLARERGMRVVTITRFEHLRDVLREMRQAGEPAYVGMCCSNFYLKRTAAFREAGIPAVLVDIGGSNCYELRQEDQAYAGRFTAEAHLDGEVVEKVMYWVPMR